jgi:predicted nucleotidyltransferase
MSVLRVEMSSVRAAAELLRGMGATEVYVFGSAVKGGMRVNSDVDMAVKGLPPALYFTAVSRASDVFGRPVDLVDLDDPTPIVHYLRDSGGLVRVP